MSDAQQQAARLITDYVTQYKPLTIAANLAWWDASISGEDEDFQRRKDAENKLVELHGDRAVFARIKSLRAGPISDPVVKRQLDVMYYNFLPYQANPELSKRIVSLVFGILAPLETMLCKTDGDPLCMLIALPD